MKVADCEMGRGVLLRGGGRILIEIICYMYRVKPVAVYGPFQLCHRILSLWPVA
jgi:hypothetical protein